MAFDPINAEKDLLVIMMEAYAATLGRSLVRSRAGLKKRRLIADIFRQFVPVFRARRFSSPCAIRARFLPPRLLWRKHGNWERSRPILHQPLARSGGVALPAMHGDDPTTFVVPYEKLVLETADWMQRICAFLEIEYDPAVVLTPTKAGKFWGGNSATEAVFARISDETVDPLAGRSFRG